MSAPVKRIIFKTPAAVGAVGQFSALERCRAYASASSDDADSAQASASSAQISSNVALAARDAALAAVGSVKASPTDAVAASLDESVTVTAPLVKEVLSPGGDETFSLSVAVMAGAGASNAGLAGVAPAPQAGDHERFLRGDATWQPLDRASVGMSAVEDTWMALEGPVTVMSASQAAVPGDQLGKVMPGGIPGRAIRLGGQEAVSGFVADAVYDSVNARTVITLDGFQPDGQSTALQVGQDPRNAPSSSSTGSDLYLAETYNCLMY
uniref:Uncharacterized protein n=1 Tax=Fundidesulfovibrio putealis TaxID=270496 RepID=A0A7C4EM57_9BACT